MSKTSVDGRIQGLQKLLDEVNEVIDDIGNIVHTNDLNALQVKSLYNDFLRGVAYMKVTKYNLIDKINSLRLSKFGLKPINVFNGIMIWLKTDKEEVQVIARVKNKDEIYTYRLDELHRVMKYMDEKYPGKGILE